MMRNNVHTITRDRAGMWWWKPCARYLATGSPSAIALGAYGSYDPKRKVTQKDSAADIALARKIARLDKEARLRLCADRTKRRPAVATRAGDDA